MWTTNSMNTLGYAANLLRISYHKKFLSSPVPEPEGSPLWTPGKGFYPLHSQAWYASLALHHASQRNLLTPHLWIAPRNSIESLTQSMWPPRNSLSRYLPEPHTRTPASLNIVPYLALTLVIVTWSRALTRKD